VISTVCFLDLFLECLRLILLGVANGLQGSSQSVTHFEYYLRWENMVLNPDRDNGAEGRQGEDLKIILQVSFLVMSVFVLAGRWEGTIREKADNAEAKGKEKEKPINDMIENHTYRY
jgi:hypothetical protein